MSLFFKGWDDARKAAVVNARAYAHDTYQEAVTDARKYGLAVVQRTYIYDDHELVWTPDGPDIWPPHDTPFEEEA